MHEMSAKYRQLKATLDGTFLSEKRAITSCYLPASDVVSIIYFPEGAHERHQRVTKCDFMMSLSEISSVVYSLTFCCCSHWMCFFAFVLALWSGS